MLEEGGDAEWRRWHVLYIKVFLFLLSPLHHVCACYAPRWMSDVGDAKLIRCVYTHTHTRDGMGCVHKSAHIVYWRQCWNGCIFSVSFLNCARRVATTMRSVLSPVLI